MEVTGQLHAPAALLPEKNPEPPHPLDGRVGVPRADVDVYTEILKHTHKREINYRRNLVSPDTIIHTAMPYSITSNQILFFSQDVSFIFLPAAAEDYTTKSIRSSLIRVRILQSYVSIRHCKTCLKKTKILVLYYGSTLQCGAHAVYYVTPTHITRPHYFIASIPKSYILFQYSHVAFITPTPQIT
jgi:hypothetical protein